MRKTHLPFHPGTGDYGDEHDGSLKPGQTVIEWLEATSPRIDHSRESLLPFLVFERSRGIADLCTLVIGCRCPFPDHVHNGSNTFWFSLEYAHFECYGCYRKGSTVEYLMHRHRVNRGEARRLLEEWDVKARELARYREESIRLTKTRVLAPDPGSVDSESEQAQQDGNSPDQGDDDRA